MKVLGLSGSLRAGSHNSKLLRAAGDLLPGEAELVEFDGLKLIPPFDEDDEQHPPRRGAGAVRRDRRRRRRPRRHPRVQPLDPGSAQERARLALPAAGRIAPAQQARRGRRRLHRPVRRGLGPGRGAQGPRRDRRPRDRPRAARSAWPTTPSTPTATWSTTTSRWRWPASSPSCTPRPAPRSRGRVGRPLSAARRRPRAADAVRRAAAGASARRTALRAAAWSRPATDRRTAAPCRARGRIPADRGSRVVFVLRAVRELGRCGSSPSHAGRSRSISVTAVASRGRRSGRRSRSRWGARDPVDVVGGRVRRLRARAPRARARPRRSARPRPAARRRSPTGCRSCAPAPWMSGLSNSRQTSSSTAQPPASVIATPSPPGRWKPRCCERAHTRNSTANDTSSTAASTNVKTPERRHVGLHDLAGLEVRLLVPRQEQRERERDGRERGQLQLLGEAGESLRRLIGSGCPPPRARSRGGALEALDRVVEDRADRDQQLAQRVGELAGELGRQRPRRPSRARAARPGPGTRSTAAAVAGAPAVGRGVAAAARAASSARACASRTSRSAAS